MTDIEILKKAIEKAMANGWKGYDYCYAPLNDFETPYIEYNAGIKDLIFSHDFSKALWGEKKVWVCSCGYVGSYKTDKDGWPITSHECDPEWSYGSASIAWKVHLQQMVLEEDPIKYLEQFIAE